MIRWQSEQLGRALSVSQGRLDDDRYVGVIQYAPSIRKRPALVVSDKRSTRALGYFVDEDAAREFCEHFGLTIVE